MNRFSFSDTMIFQVLLKIAFTTRKSVIYDFCYLMELFDLFSLFDVILLALTLRFGSLAFPLGTPRFFTGEPVKNCYIKPF